MTKPELAESSGEAGPFRSRKNGTNSAAATAAVKSAGGAEPHGIAKHRAITKPELAKTSGQLARPIQPLLQQSQILLMKLDLQGLRSTAPRQNPELSGKLEGNRGLQERCLPICDRAR